VKSISKVDLISLACQKAKKHAMMISFDPRYQEGGFELFASEVIKAAPYLANFGDWPQFFEIFMDGEGVLFFDSEKEMLDAFSQTVGDNGPTNINSYDGQCAVYALTFYPDGKLGVENT